MSQPTLLDDLRRRGMELAADGPQLRCRAPRGELTPEVRRIIGAHKVTLLAELEAEAAWRIVEEIADAGNRKAAAALALDAVGAHEEAERLRADVRDSVVREWLPAMQDWARAADRAGQLPAVDRWVLEATDDEGAPDGWQQVGDGWQETEARQQRCVFHADRELAPGDTIACSACRARLDEPDVGGGEAPAPAGSQTPRRPGPQTWRCICLSTERRYRDQWDDWVCAREQCGMIVPSPKARP